MVRPANERPAHFMRSDLAECLVALNFKYLNKAKWTILCNYCGATKIESFFKIINRFMALYDHRR